MAEPRDVGAVLGRAFLEDPVFGWLVRGNDREARLIRMFSTFARARSAHLLAVPEGSAAAIWRPPGEWRGGLRELVTTAPALAVEVRGGVVRGLRLERSLEKHHPREPHWYLEALGALPEARGTGVGGRVVQPVLDRCDSERVPAYLESSNPRNWSFYERLGFVRGTPLPVPPGCPLLMPMWREPR